MGRTKTQEAPPAMEPSGIMSAHARNRGLTAICHGCPRNLQNDGDCDEAATLCSHAAGMLDAVLTATHGAVTQARFVGTFVGGTSDRRGVVQLDGGAQRTLKPGDRVAGLSKE